MKDAIEKAIERSINHTEIVTIKGDIAALCDEIDERSHGDVTVIDAGGGVIEVCGVDTVVSGWADTEDHAWRLRLEPDYAEIVEGHLKGWAESSPEFVRITSGFVAWVWDIRQETLAALMDREDDEIVRELVYAVSQKTRGLSDERLEDAAREVLDYHRADFVESLRESLADYPID